MAPSTSFVRDFLKPLPFHSVDRFDSTSTLEQLQQFQEINQQDGTREEDSLTRRLLLLLYARSLEMTLSQALEAEMEAEWWSDVERTRWKVFWYLIQTLPSRVYSSLRTTRKAKDKIKLSTTRPEVILTSLFPHLQQRPHLHQFQSAQDLHLPSPSITAMEQSLHSCIESVRALFQTFQEALLVPLHYTLQEVSLKKHELLRIRDDRARTLGSLVTLRPEVLNYLNSGLVNSDRLAHLTKSLHLALNFESVQDESYTSLSRLSDLATHSQKTSLQLHSLGLSRPSRLTRLWPRLVFGPPALVYSVYYLYSSRGTLLNFVYDAKDVVKGFIVDWCVKPLADVLDTVKASKADQAGWLVTKEGVQADYDSLERMARSLASDHLRYTPSQLDELSARIRLGDLTPVLKLYEEDIKSPFKSAVGGTLLRTVFIQVQKAKVDLDQALSGIDRLMKSQELTFAFVGLSPALAVVYVVGGYLRRIIWASNNDKDVYGGLKERERVFWSMRRAERLLVLDGTSGARDIAASNDSNSSSRKIAISRAQPSPLTTGLLILSLTRLRTYAEKYLPSSSSSSQEPISGSTTAVAGVSNNTGSASTSPSPLSYSYSVTSLREAFLEDLSDLQDPELGVDQKRMVVERMWRCWGGTVFGRMN